LKFNRFLFLILISGLGCVHQAKPDHYFLDGYPDLIFKNFAGDPVPTRFFIVNETDNGSNTYRVLDTTLTLVDRKDGEPYSGFIRTFHWGIYNLEAIFEDGKIERLRYWHPNRILGMDINFIEQTGQVWNSDGARSIYWNESQHVHFNPATQRPREIQEDSLTTYFNNTGNIESYTIRTDTMSFSYFPDGTPRYFRPLGYRGNGEVKRWHSNGQLRAEGRFRNWEEVGVWVEYDSLGNEVDRVDYNSLN